MKEDAVPKVLYLHRNRSKATESELVSNSTYLNRIIVPNHPHSLKYPLHLFTDRLSLQLLLLYLYSRHIRGLKQEQDDPAI